MRNAQTRNVQIKKLFTLAVTLIRDRNTGKTNLQNFRQDIDRHCSHHALQENDEKVFGNNAFYNLRDTDNEFYSHRSSAKVRRNQARAEKSSGRCFGTQYLDSVLKKKNTHPQSAVFSFFGENYLHLKTNGL